MKVNMIRLKKSSILIFLLIILLFRPTILIQFPAIDTIVSLLGNIVSIYAIFMWLINRVRSDKWLLRVGFFCATLIVCTLLEGGKLYFVFASIRIFAGCLILDRLAEKYSDRFFCITKYALATLVFINLISMIVFPNGIIQIAREANEWYSYQVSWWLFGNKNGMIMWLFPLTVLSEVSILKNKNKSKEYVRDVLILVSCFATALIGKSSTTLFILLMILLFPVFYNGTRPFWNNLKPWMILTIYFGLSILLIFSSQLGIFSFLAGLFGKDATFTGRTTAWLNSVLLFIQKPLLGYGLLDADTARRYLGAYAFVNSHNTLLQVLVSGGVVLGIQYIGVLHMLMKNICNVREISPKVSALILWALFMLCIQSCFEANADSILYWNILTIMLCMVKMMKERSGPNEDDIQFYCDSEI